MPKAIRSQGTSLSYSIGSPTTFISLGNIVGFEGPGGSSTQIDTTDLSDTAYKTFMTGLIDAGDVTFDLNLDPGNASHAALKLAQEQGTSLEIKITPPAAGTALSLYFNAYVKQFRVSASQDNKYKASCAFMCNGAYNWL